MRAITTNFVQLADTISVPLARPIIGAQILPTGSGLFLCAVSVFYTLANDSEVSGQLALISHSNGLDVLITGENDEVTDIEGPVFYTVNAGVIQISLTDTINTCAVYEGLQTAGNKTLNLSGVVRAPFGKKTVLFAAIETTGVVDGLSTVFAAFSAVEIELD